MPPTPKTIEIHDLISTLLEERGRHDPTNEELEMDPTLEWINHTKYLPIRDFDVSQSETCDGYLVSWVLRNDECFYMDRSADEELFGIVVYKPGKWEELLRQEVKKDYNYGCSNEEWLEHWREQVDLSNR